MLQGPVKVGENETTTTLMQYFQKGFTRHRIKADHMALRYQGRLHSFHDLDQVSTQICIILKKKLSEHHPLQNGVNQDGDLVIGICLPPCDKLIFILFAILKLGAAYLPLDPCGPVERTKKICKVAQPALLIVDCGGPQNMHAKFQLDHVVGVDEIWNEVEVEKICQIGNGGQSNKVGEKRRASLGSNFQFFRQNQKNIEKNQPNIAAILFTSGTTGEPKGVRLSHKTILNRLQWQWTEFPFGPHSKENCCLKTATTFVDSIPEIFGPLLQGHQLIIFDRREVTQPHILAQRILDHKISQLLLVPSLLKALLKTMDLIDQKSQKSKKLRPLASVKLWICSGEPLTYDLIENFFRHQHDQGGDDVKLCNFYGSTEIMDVTFQIFRSMDDVHRTSSRSSALLTTQIGSNFDKSDQNQVIPLGIPLWNTTVYVLNPPDLEMASDGQVGEIFVAGYHVGSGYVGHGQGQRQSDRYLSIRWSPSDKKFVEESDSNPQPLRLYRTGDFGWIQGTQNGGQCQRLLFYGGRIDSQVKVRGHRVDLGDIKAVLDGGDLDMIQNSIVLCYQRDQPEQQIVAFLVLEKMENADEDKNLEKITKILHSKLLEYQMPLISIVSKIPLLVHGKTDQQKLLEDFHQQRLRQMEFDENNNNGDDGVSDDWREKIKILNKNKNDLGPTVKILLTTISKFTGKPAQDLKPSDSFYAIGGTSLNSIAVLSHLKTLNYFISIENFVSAQTLSELLQFMEPLMKMDTAQSQNDPDCTSIDPKFKYEVTPKWSKPIDPSSHSMTVTDQQQLSIEMLNQSHKTDVIGIFSAGFAHKGDLEVYAQLTYTDFEKEFLTLWPSLLAAGYSFIARRRHDDKIVGVCLNLDENDKPKDSLEGCSKGTEKIWDFLDNIGKPFRHQLPKGKGQILYCYVVATHEQLTESENFYVIHWLEKENVRLAQFHNFQGILTENTNALTQKMATDVLGYRELCSVQINEYEDPKNGSKPFIFAPDDQRVTVCWKQIGVGDDGGDGDTIEKM